MEKEIVEGYLANSLLGIGGGCLRVKPMSRFKSAFWKLGSSEIDFGVLPISIKEKFAGKHIRVTFEEID